MMTSGARVAAETAATDDRYVLLRDLHPKSSVYAVVNERSINYPEELKSSADALSSIED